MPETIRPRPSGISLADVVAWVRDRMSPTREVEPFDQPIQKIEDIGKMTPGWNGFKAAVASKDVRLAAINFLRDIPKRFPQPVHAPTLVAPTPDGGIALVWRLADAPQEIEFIFGPDGVYEWALREKERTIRCADDSNPNELYDVLKQHVLGRVAVSLQ